MAELLFLVPAFPLAGFLLLIFGGRRMSTAAIARIGVGSVGLAAVVSYLVAASGETTYHQRLWSWMNVFGLEVDMGLHLDGLSLVMMLTVTTVGFLIHLYATEFMKGDPGYARFFAYMNFFVGAMLVLLLADNLVLLYLGWEGVGLASYLLIGFWYEDRANGRAARKAFLVTRIGDAAMAIGLFVLFTELGTFDIQALMERAEAAWEPGAPVVIAAAALLLAGALGKSAQLPLQTWLPDAMAGPTPVSALIHAATMVTAGVYLIARTHVLFVLAPPVLALVAAIGAATLLLAAASALGQHDFKRVLAYSTMSQIGYMFVALGVGAFSAAIFHFFTHAFFKALLFLGAGVAILATDEHDVFAFGGLRKKLPVAFWTFLAGAASLAGLPLVTAGFYSKEAILLESWASERGGALLLAAGVAGSFLTAVYIFRVVFLVFFGEERAEVHRRPGKTMLAPLVVLAAFSLGAGFGHSALAAVLRNALPDGAAHEAGGAELLLQAATGALSLVGIYLAYLLYEARAPWAAGFFERLTPLRRLAEAGFGFDAVYDRAFVRPVVAAARVNRRDFIDAFYRALATGSIAIHGWLSRSENGRLRWYAAVLAGGTIVFVAMVVLT